MAPSMISRRGRQAMLDLASASIFWGGGRGSRGLDLNSQADAFPDFASYQQILQPGSLGLPPIRPGSRSTVATSRPPFRGGGGDAAEVVEGEEEDEAALGR